MSSHALQCDEGGQHAYDHGLAFTSANSSQESLGQLPVTSLLGSRTASANSEHQHNDHLRVVRQHQHIVLLLHDLCSTCCNVEDHLPLWCAKLCSMPLYRPFETKALVADGIPNLNIRASSCQACIRKRFCVDLLHALQQGQEILRAFMLRAFLLEVRVGDLQVLFLHVLEGEDDCVQGAEAARPSLRRIVLHHFGHNVLNLLAQLRRHSPLELG
mmetsp:Transcript_40757/g.93811  ORF Transcript_40757/g.93811 Transcript_40757/m.93811 type:complete len:215 (+) Transcript_40757:2887-3531(+)